jgi:hypothetical protein
MTTFISLIFEKKCHIVISHTIEFSLFMIMLEGKHKVTTTTIASSQYICIKKKQVNKIVEEHTYIFSPTRVPLQIQFKNSIDLVANSPSPNGTIYICSLLENESLP